MGQTDDAKILTNCHLATMQAGSAPYGTIHDGAVAVHQGRIQWAGLAAELPETYQGWHRKDLAGRYLLPALIDCHTHLVYGGNRVEEFEQRLNGKSYAELAAAGGGILSTVRATRAASLSELIDVSRPRLQQMAAFGVATIEIKSGYGLNLIDEIKMLEAARALGQETGMRVRTTFLGAHALPEEFAGKSGAYIDHIVSEMLPEIARRGLADAVDVFCEHIGFSLSETRRVLEAAIALDLPVHLHAEQLTNLHGAQMAAELGALSCDHLEYLDEAGAKAMAKAGTVGVILPGAYYFLRETRQPPIQMMLDHGVDLAIATDCNPGSSPTTNLPLMLSMACTLFGLTPEQALTGATRHAAKALGLGDKIGQIAAGFTADLVAWDISSPAELSYGFGQVPKCERV
ncbi:MAG: imidazolonepropionase [Robiginitomaculum sp.]|nr:MAG: imidazolonepropionase [Robiginitomaculum sp.]